MSSAKTNINTYFKVITKEGGRGTDGGLVNNVTLTDTQGQVEVEGLEGQHHPRRLKNMLNTGN